MFSFIEIKSVCTTFKLKYVFLISVVNTFVSSTYFCLYKLFTSSAKYIKDESFTFTPVSKNL